MMSMVVVLRLTSPVTSASGCSCGSRSRPPTPRAPPPPCWLGYPAHHQCSAARQFWHRPYCSYHLEKTPTTLLLFAFLLFQSVFWIDLCSVDTPSDFGMLVSKPSSMGNLVTKKISLKLPIYEIFLDKRLLWRYHVMFKQQCLRFLDSSIVNGIISAFGRVETLCEVCIYCTSMSKLENPSQP